MKYINIVGIAIIIGMLIFHVNEGGVGSVSFPTSLDTFTNPGATDSTATVSHSSQHSDANDAIEALQVKVGADGSATTTTHTYKLSGVTGSDLACSLTGTETLTNKTLTSPNITGLIATTSIFYVSTTIDGTNIFSGTTTNTGSTTIDVSTAQLTLNLGSDASGDVYYRNASGYLARLAKGSDGQVLKLASGIPSWAADSTGVSIITRGYATTSQTLSTSYGQLNFGEDYDSGSDYDPVTGTFTVPSTGYYDINAVIYHNYVRAVDMAIYVNGSASSTAEVGSNDVDRPAYIADTLYLTAGDTVTFYAKHLGGATTVTVTSGITKSHFTIKGL